MSVLDKLYKKFNFKPVLKNRAGKMKVTQWYGENNVPFYKQMGLLGHPALDMSASIGTNSYAPVPGTITALVHDIKNDTRKGEWIEMATKTVTIEKVKYQLRLKWYHISRGTRIVGDKVRTGDRVCLTGNTGKYTTGPHLHFSVTPYKMTQVGWVKAFQNNGYNGRIDPYPFFYKKDFISRPSNETNLYPGLLMKSKYDNKVYYVDSDKKLTWIQDERSFEYGRDNNWWGDWNLIKTVSPKLTKDLTLNIE